MVSLIKLVTLDANLSPYQALVNFYKNTNSLMLPLLQRAEKKDFHLASWKTLLTFDQNKYDKIFGETMSNEIKELLEDVLGEMSQEVTHSNSIQRS